jgi:hypothetical protein
VEVLAVNPRTVIVAFDIKKTDASFGAYDQLSAKDKILLVAKKIRETCEALRNKEPQAKLYFAWREYGITEKNSRFVSPETNDFFKKTMLELNSEFPNLTIVSGTMATREHVAGDEYQTRLDQIEKDYEQHQWIRAKEEASGAHQSQIVLELKKIDELKKSNQSSGINFVRNTCSIFRGGDIWEHDKTVPFMETKDHDQKQERKESASSDGLENLASIFQPGNDKNSSPMHDEVGVEICREHMFGVLSRACEQSVDEKKSNTPQIHFIVSDHVKLNLNNIRGDFVVQLDGVNDASLMATAESKKNVVLYQVNLLDKALTLKGPMQPFHPVSLKIINILNKAIIQFPEKHEKRLALVNIRDIFGNSQPDAKNMFDCLNSLIKAHTPELTKKEGKCASLFRMFTKALPDAKKVCIEILTLAKREKDALSLQDSKMDSHSLKGENTKLV